jgi:hypothetical protein
VPVSGSLPLHQQQEGGNMAAPLTPLLLVASAQKAAACSSGDLGGFMTFVIGTMCVLFVVLLIGFALDVLSS